MLALCVGVVCALCVGVMYALCVGAVWTFCVGVACVLCADFGADDGDESFNIMDTHYLSRQRAMQR